MTGAAPRLKALILDVDGTLAETEELHRHAFNAAFANRGLGWHWSSKLYRTLLRTAGGRERIAAFQRDHAPACRLTAEEIARLHAEKTALYGRMVAEGALRPRPGIDALIEEARRHGLRLAIATTTSRPNVEALVRAIWNRPAGEMFEVIASGDEVRRKKPDPEFYQLALARLGIDGSEALAFEDSRNGLLAARAAGIATIIAPGPFSADQDFNGAAAVMTEFSDGLPLAALAARCGMALPRTAARPIS